MSNTIVEQTQIKSPTILYKVLCKILKINDLPAKILTPEEEEQGKDLGGFLYGGKKINGPTVLLVKREEMRQRFPERLFISDLVVTRDPTTGCLVIQYDQDDRLWKLDQKQKEELVKEYAKEAIDEHLEKCPITTISNWQNYGDYQEKIVEINVEDIPYIPICNTI